MKVAEALVSELLPDFEGVLIASKLKITAASRVNNRNSNRPALLKFAVEILAQRNYFKLKK